MQTFAQPSSRKRVKSVERIAFGLDEIAAALGVSTSFVRLEVNRKNLKAYRLGGRVLVAADSFQAYLAARAE